MLKVRVPRKKWGGGGGCGYVSHGNGIFRALSTVSIYLNDLSTVSIILAMII